MIEAGRLPSGAMPQAALAAALGEDGVEVKSVPLFERSGLGEDGCGAGRGLPSGGRGSSGAAMRSGRGEVGVASLDPRPAKYLSQSCGTIG